MSPLPFITALTLSLLAFTLLATEPVPPPGITKSDKSMNRHE